MTRKCTHTFLCDQSGASTVLAIFWFMLFCALGGLAIDSTNGFRVQTMMQATADASAHAGVIDLPDEDAAIDTALAYAEINMPADTHGTVLRQSDVEIGVWEPATRTFVPLAVSPNAVRVTLRSTRATGNPVPTSFLRIIGKDWWDVNVQATAALLNSKCYNDGLIASGIVDIETGNTFVNHICIHGEQGVDLQEFNTFEEGVSVTMAEWPDTLVMPAQGYEKNPGLEQADNQDSMTPDIGNIEAIVQGMLDLDPNYLPQYVDATSEVITVGTDFKFEDYQEGAVYHVECNSVGQQTDIATNTLIQNVVIVSDCILNNGSGTTFSNVVLASTGVGNGDKPLDLETIHLSDNVVLGTDYCGDNVVDGGAVIYSYASVKTSMGTQINGARIYAKGNIELTSDNQGIEGIAAHAGGDIHLTTDNAMGLCHEDPGGGENSASYAIVD